MVYHWRGALAKCRKTIVSDRGDVRCKNWFRSDAVAEQSREFFDALRVLRTEARGGRAVEIDDRDHLSVSDHGHHQLGLARRIAGNMAGKGVDVVNALGLESLGRHSAHALANWDTDTGRATGKGAEDQFLVARLAFTHAIKACPIEIGNKLRQKRGDVGHIRDGVTFAAGQSVRCINQLPIELWRIECVVRFEIEHSECALPT